MKMINLGFVALLLVSITACGSRSESASEEKPQGVIPEHQLKVLEDAKNIEKLLQKTDEQRKKLEGEVGL